MADKERTSQRRPTTPEEYSTFASSSPPGGDYKLTVDMVGTLQNQLGRLTEAVEGLKATSKEHSSELKQIGKDIHAAKVVAGVLGGLILLVASFIAWLVNTYVSTHPPGK